MRTEVHRLRLPGKKIVSLIFAVIVCDSGSLCAHAAQTVFDSVADTAIAADEGKPKKEKDAGLEEVVVTGTLIPQAKNQEFTPVVTITNEDISARGFADIAEALQRASFSTGSVQNGQFSGGFTQGAKVTSFFGLDPSYTKYLINGLPVADYPALYNGTESFVSISGIPTALVDHIDILPVRTSRSGRQRGAHLGHRAEVSQHVTQLRFIRRFCGYATPGFRN